jgi:hypothetical protein
MTEAAPAKGNSTDEMIARTEYMLAKRMLSASQTGKSLGQLFPRRPTG